jgi:hypothetical protein
MENHIHSINESSSLIKLQAKSSRLVPCKQHDAGAIGRLASDIPGFLPEID